MRPYEFWHPRIFEAPYYLYLLAQCAGKGLPVKHLAKANYALDHGELGLGSKFSTQMAFAQDRFLATERLDPAAPDQAKKIASFADANGYPVILKPDIGAVGKGILKISSAAEIEDATRVFHDPYLVQAFTPFEHEYGVFFVRRNDVDAVTGINKKHFPSVIGNGRDSIATLARAHYRYTNHWQIFLKYVDTDRVPVDGERVGLSFIGSHTMGCKFTDDTHLITPAMERALFSVCDTQPGFNFGRLDVKAASEAAFLDGQFVIIEVNGIASLPTHMFDPANSLRRAYAIFLRHGKHLVDVACEHRGRQMDLKSYGEIWRLAKANHVMLNDIHAKAIGA